MEYMSCTDKYILVLVPATDSITPKLVIFLIFTAEKAKRSKPAVAVHMTAQH